MQSISSYREKFIEALNDAVSETSPENLYSPIRYILQLGGKRIRPVLTLMSAEIFGCDYKKAMPAALAIELFHNFSLIHDDIMDGAPLRRGNKTVHEKWDLNTGILSGDAMLILAYQCFEGYPPETFKSLVKLFSKTAIEVCEGQQYDIDFETRNNVTVSEYLQMIELKTAVLLGAAMEMGAIISGTTSDNCRRIYDYGRYLGIAFQIQDDYLDAFGDPEKFGKQVGGDIIENKKTYMYLKAKEFASDQETQILAELFTSKPENNEEKINRVKDVYLSTGAESATLKAIEEYTTRAFLTLEGLDIPEENIEILKLFGTELMRRKV
ncbi:MAG: polyprenyl synthetase family protein [Bacteroidia bacterium]